MEAVDPTIYRLAIFVLAVFVAVQGGAMIGFAIRELNPRFRNEREEA